MGPTIIVVKSSNFFCCCRDYELNSRPNSCLEGPHEMGVNRFSYSGKA